MAYYGVAYTRKILDTRNFSFKYDGDLENGSFVKKGNIVSEETQIYEALPMEDLKDELYLINTPPTDYDTSRSINQNAENFINKNGTIARGYRIIKDSKFDLSVYSIDGGSAVAEDSYVFGQLGSTRLIASVVQPVLDDYGFVGKIERIYEKGFFYPIGEFGTDLTLTIDGVPQYMGGVIDGRINFAVIEVIKNG